MLRSMRKRGTVPQKIMEHSKILEVRSNKGQISRFTRKFKIAVKAKLNKI